MRWLLLVLKVGSCSLSALEPAHVTIIFEKYSINVDSHIRMSTHPYEHTHEHPNLMSTSEPV
jgi:hypothetical protein